MVRGLILATAVSLCVANNCAADAVRRVHVVDPAEAMKQKLDARAKKLQALQQRVDEARRLSKLTRELLSKQSQILVEILQEKDQDTSNRLQAQLDELKGRIRQLQLQTRGLLLEQANER